MNGIIITNPEQHTTLFAKNSMFAFISILVGDESGVVQTYDPRNGRSFNQIYSTRNITIDSYQMCIDTTLERGWKQVWQGKPNNARLS
jgi:hypothetical protein